MGLRYRVDMRADPSLRRRADIVFSRAKVAVFVDGCFWHACPDHGSSPKANAVWWKEKLRTNVTRDRDTDERLRSAGWKVIRVWEHEAPAVAAVAIADVVAGRKGRDDVDQRQENLTSRRPVRLPRVRPPPAGG
jgi:DNA mismatch endonuclease (patch repair protein)